MIADCFIHISVPKIFVEKIATFFQKKGRGVKGHLELFQKFIDNGADRRPLHLLFHISVLLFYCRNIGWFRMDTCHYSPLYKSLYIGSLIDFSIYMQLCNVHVCVAGVEGDCGL